MSSLRSANASSGSIILTKRKEKEIVSMWLVVYKLSLQKIHQGLTKTLTQNSAKCLEVFEFSARNVGPNVYT